MPGEFRLVAPREFAFREYEERPLQAHEVRVRTLVSGIKTGTELNLYTGKTPFLTQSFDPEYRMFLPRPEGKALYPLTLGSWMVGEVIEASPEVTHFQVGDRVHGGLPHRPTHTVHEDRLYPVRAGVSSELMVFTDPAIFALGAVHDAQIKVGDRVAVFGMGALGLLAIQIARLNGAELVVAVEPIARRRALAVEFGADVALDPNAGDVGRMIKDMTGRKGVDTAIEISGAYAALNEAIRCIQQEGLIVTAGYYKGGDQLKLGAEWHHNRPTMRSSMMVWDCSHRSTPLWDLQRVEETAIRLLESDKLQAGPMVSHRFSYADVPEAYSFLENHIEDTVKVLLTYP